MPKVHPPVNLQPLGSIKLGRLVLKLKDPQQEFHDPFQDRPNIGEYSTKIQTHFSETNNFSKCSKLQPYLTDMLSLSCELRGQGETSLAAPQATTHQLQNSSTWFRDACGNQETRKWIEEAVNNGHDVYLVVGLFILQDATLSKGAGSGRAGIMSVGLPMIPLPIVAAGPGITTAISSGIQCIQDTAYGHMVAFTAPGDQIFGIRYRKVKFKWFSSRKVSNSFLEMKTRWKPYWEWRGEDGEDGEDEDILEASLTDEGDLEIPDEGEGEGEEMLEASLPNEGDSEMSEQGSAGDSGVDCMEIGAQTIDDRGVKDVKDDRTSQSVVNALPRLSKEHRGRLIKRLLDKSKKPKTVRLQKELLEKSKKLRKGQLNGNGLRPVKKRD